MNADKNRIDISTLSSEEIIEHYIVLLMKQAEDIKAGDIDQGHATLLALLQIAQSLDTLEHRVYHMVQVLESISDSLDRRP